MVRGVKLEKDLSVRAVKCRVARATRPGLATSARRRESAQTLSRLLYLAAELKIPVPPQQASRVLQ